MAATPDYAARLQAYAEDVTQGRAPACKALKLACQRHLNDLKRAQQPDYPYYWDLDAANRICSFAELFPHVKGRWGKAAGDGKLLRLQGWQIFTLGVPFGWKRRDNHRRRFREIYACIPRKNGKSILSAVVGIYMLIADDEHGAEVYSGATTEKQAWEVFGPARQMLLKSPDVMQDAGVEVGARSIVRLDDLSKFQPVIGKPGDGASPSCAIIDEFHEHQTSDLYDTMNTGMGAREQPMVVIITTSGTQLASPCHIKHQQAEKVLNGVLENDELFAIIFTIDEDSGDDWASPEVLRKANPNYGVSVDPDYLAAQQRQAVLSPEYQNRFKTKHLNIWCSASIAGINLASWRAATDAGLRIEEFAGQPYFAILDLASRVDICAYVKLFVKWVDGQRHYYPFPRFFLPEQTIEEDRPNQQAYRGWVQRGFLTATPGAEIDFDEIGDVVTEDATKYQCLEVVYDPWRATQLAQQLTKRGATTVEYPQTAKFMGDAYDELLSAIKGGRFHHDGNPVMTWMAANVIQRPAAKGVVVPGKDKRENKIDGIVAVTMGVGRALAATEGDMSGFMGWVQNAVTV